MTNEQIAVRIETESKEIVGALTRAFGGRSQFGLDVVCAAAVGRVNNQWSYWPGKNDRELARTLAFSAWAWLWGDDEDEDMGWDEAEVRKSIATLTEAAWSKLS